MSCSRGIEILRSSGPTLSGNGVSMLRAMNWTFFYGKLKIRFPCAASRRWKPFAEVCVWAILRLARKPRRDGPHGWMTESVPTKREKDFSTSYIPLWKLEHMDSPSRRYGMSSKHPWAAIVKVNKYLWDSESKVGSIRSRTTMDVLGNIQTLWRRLSCMNS